MKRVGLFTLLVVVWVLLWDRITVGQVLAGAVVSGALLLVLRRPPGASVATPTRPLAVARLGWWFAGQFVTSNLLVARAALLPRYVRPGVVRVELHTRSDELVALVANITALSPGMQPIAIHQDPPSIDVHVLTLDDPGAAAALVLHLEELVLAAFSSESDEVAAGGPT